jgi:2-polyprenyl-6-hydroxyphenyl methylase/3-demethylubiquinone-9 3-methyltransferase
MNGRTTVDHAEVEQFGALAAQWWDPKGPMAMLHKFNPVRLAYIRDQTAAHFERDPKQIACLSGLRFLDIGCGAGILSEPLARIGATMIGADAAEANIEVARAHAGEGGLDIDYRATTAEALADAGEKFDVVLAMEVVEHVADMPLFVRRCAEMVKPGGLMFAATLNRTMKSFALAIVGAEYVLRWVPRGTHDWRKFLKPSEVVRGLRNAGVEAQEIVGVVYSPLSRAWSLDRRDLDVNYMLYGSKGVG